MKTSDVILEEAVRNAMKGQVEKDKKRRQFVIENTMEWLEQGEKLKARREKHNMSLREVATRLGTSATRIRSLEVGDPVSMAKHLTVCYNLLFDHIELHNALFTFYKDNQWRG